MANQNLLHAGPWASWRGDTTALDARLGMVIDDLRALAPDIATVQETSRSRHAGVVARRLADALGLHYFVFEPATTHLSPLMLLNNAIVTLLGFMEGPAIISRFPIVDHKAYALPRCKRRFDPRILLRANVATPWGPLTVYTTHTSSDPCQVRRITAVLRAEAAPGPVIVTGDFNKTDTSDSMRELVRDLGLADAFRSVHPEAPGYTVYQRPWAPTATVSRRVDYIFVGGVPDPARAVCDSRVILDRPRREPDGRTLWPSDHYGVVADLGVFGIKCAP